MLHIDYDASGKSPLHVAIAAGIAGAVGRGASTPIDVVKVGSQVGAAECRQSTLYSFLNIMRLEGVRGFMKGAIVGSVRMAPFAAIQFGAWDPVRKVLETNRDIGIRRFYRRYIPASAAVAGGITTVSATLLTYPLDVVKTRVIAQSLQPHLRYYSSLPDLIRHMIVTEGVMSMFRGMLPSLIGAGIFGSALFGTKDLLDEWLWFQNRYELKWWQALINCTLAAGVGSGAAYPFDVIRKKMQAYTPTLPKHGRTDVEFKINSMSDCAVQTWRQQGHYGLVRGLVPNMMRVVPLTVGMYVTFKILCYGMP